VTAVLVDAFDSFVHIIAHYLTRSGIRTVVLRSDVATPDRILAEDPSAVVLGPGPGRPEASGHVQLVDALAGTVPLLGVCLGHQAIGVAFGARVERADHLMHGKTSVLRHDGRGMFAAAAPACTVARYHSLVVAEASLPAELVVSARSTDDGYVMGLRHRTLPIESVQFHPESVATAGGATLFDSFFTAHCG
jgi:anthranilate synthase component II